MRGPITINGVTWEPRPDSPYKRDYYSLVKKIRDGPTPNDKYDLPQWALNNWELYCYRSYIAHDPHFFTTFVLKIPHELSNHPFWVRACRDVEEGPQTNTLDLWAREHAKTTIISTTRTIQKLLLNKEERIALFSWSKPIAVSMLRTIMHVLEQSEFLQDCFPDVLYRDPRTEADKWSESEGIIVKRDGFYREGSIEAYGLIESPPTGKHYSGRVYDDIVVQEHTNSPEVMRKVQDAFDMSKNLGTLDGWHWVIGTHYHYEDPLMYLRKLTYPDGKPVYTVRIKPATDDGTPNGKPVFLPQARLEELKLNRQQFYSQQLLDPTPQGTAPLGYDRIKEVEPDEIPKRLFKFMAVDPAGENKDRSAADCWGLILVGVEPFRDDLGASNIYILDMKAEVLKHSEAMQAIVDMYIRSGQVLKLGVEKVAMAMSEVHVASALHARGRLVTIENGSLEILRPAGRTKVERIEGALQWPLINGKIHISKSVPVPYRERLKTEMNRFPFWHDDLLDALSYVYDMIRGYRFGPVPSTQPVEQPKRYRRKRSEHRSWMVQ